MPQLRGIWFVDNPWISLGMNTCMKKIPAGQGITTRIMSQLFPCRTPEYESVDNILFRSLRLSPISTALKTIDKPCKLETAHTFVRKKVDL